MRTGGNGLPTGWRTVRLGEVAEVAFSSVDKKTLVDELPVKLCNYTDVFYNRRISPSMAFMDATASSIEHQRWALQKGDVLFTKDSETPDEIGIPAYVSEDMPNVLCGYHLGRARPHAEIADGSFLAELLGSPQVARKFGQIANGVTRFGLTLGATNALPIPLPPLAEQRAIAEVLDSIDAAIERTDDVIASTERLRDSLLHELLTRGVPGWHTSWRDEPGIGTVPASWEVVRLGEVTEIAARQVDPREARFHSLLFVAPDDIESDTGRLRSRRTVGDVRAISGKYWFNSDEVLFSKIRPYLNKVYIPNEPGLCSADIYPIQPLSGVSKGFLALALLSPSFADYTRTCSDRTGIPKVNRVDLWRYSFALPPLEEQQAITDMLDTVDATVERAREERASLQRLKASASDALLTGRVRVRV